MPELVSQNKSSKIGIVLPLVRILAFLALFVLALSLFSHKIIDSDIWWHLRAGKYIVETRTIPQTDMFSYTAEGNRWIDLHWLFQALLYVTHDVLGPHGLSLLFLLVFSSVFGILWMAADPQKNPLPAALFFLLALLASSSRFLARPEAFTYLMISLFVLILHKRDQGHWRKGVYTLIPLQAIWTNMQGLFILGPFLIFAYLVKASLAELPYMRTQHDAAHAQKKVGPLTLVFIGAVAACLLNPYGFEGLLFPFVLFTRASNVQNVFAESIAELQPPFSGHNLTSSLRYFGFLMVLSAIVHALDLKNLKASHLIIFGGTAYLALNARRNVAVFTIAVLPFTVEHAGNLLRRIEATRKDRFPQVVAGLRLASYAVIFFVAAFQTVRIWTNEFYIVDKRPERFGFGFKEQTFPRGAFLFAKENDIRGPFFNNLDLGGMFIWEMFPAEKVFIDPRLEVNSPDLFSEYRRATFDKHAFAALSDKHNFNAAIINHTAQDGLFLLPILSSLTEWKLVHLDPISAVFVRENDRNNRLLSEYAIDIQKDEIPVVAPNDTLNAKSPPLLRHLLDGITSVAPSDTEAQNRFSLGLVFLVMGEYERSVEHLEAGLQLMPFSPQAHYNIGLAYERLGDRKRAEEYYKKTISLDPAHALAHVNLGKLYDEQGLKEKAETEYELAVRWGRDMPIPLYNLGSLYYERGDHYKARKYWERALEADPSFQPARDALLRLRSLGGPAYLE